MTILTVLPSSRVPAGAGVVAALAVGLLVLAAPAWSGPPGERMARAAFLRVPAGADTVISAGAPAAASGAAPSLCMGQDGGYANDTHILMRFDDLPAIPNRDIISVRLGLFREWRGSARDDADEIVKLLMPAPQPFDAATETWDSAAVRPEPNNTLRDYQANSLPGGAPRTHLRLTVNPESRGEYKLADITAIARGWFDGSRPNQGLLLVTDFALSQPLWDGYTAFITSSEGPEDQRPFLEVTHMQRPAGMPDGRWTIVEAEGATEPERTAVTELRHYLRRVCNEWFEIQPEASFASDRPAIHVGATDFAKRHGLQPESMDGVDEFALRRVGDSLILCGSRPRGTFYAVAQFLEEFCGVRWLTFYGEEFVPQRPALALPDVDRIDRPSFAQRDFLAPAHPHVLNHKDLAGVGRCFAFNRVNGPRTAMHAGVRVPGPEYGGIYDNQMMDGHSYPAFVRPELFPTHPEYFRLVGGERRPDSFCESHPEMRELILQQLLGRIQQGGDGVYNLSPADLPIFCECGLCRELVRRHGTTLATYPSQNQSPASIDLLNFLGRGIRAEHPGVKLEMFAYSRQEAPPRDLRTEENVVVRYCPMHKYQWDPLDAPINHFHLEQLRGWAKATDHLRIFDYPYNGTVSPYYGISRTAPQDPGLRAWVQAALHDPQVAQAGLCLALQAPASGVHFFSHEPHLPRWPVPTLRVVYTTPALAAQQEAKLTASAATFVASERPDQIGADYWHSNTIAIRIEGSLDGGGSRSFGFLRFDLGSLPGDAQVVAAEFAISKCTEEGVETDQTLALYPVERGSDWSPDTLTWSTRPAVGRESVSAVPARKGHPGCGGYGGAFGDPNLRAVVRNLQIYHEVGADGVYLLTVGAIIDGMHDLTDLKYWVWMKALWDPSRGADELMDDFCRHYYGPAASQVAEYARRLEAAYEKEPLKVPWFAGNRLLQRFLSDDFLLENQRLFDQAEQATEADDLVLDRVRLARLSLDLATLFYLNRMEANHRERHGSLDGFPLDRQVIARRYREARLSTFSRRFPDLDLQAQSAEVGKILKLAGGAPRDW